MGIIVIQVVDVEDNDDEEEYDDDVDRRESWRGL